MAEAHASGSARGFDPWKSPPKPGSKSNTKGPRKEEGGPKVPEEGQIPSFAKAPKGIGTIFEQGDEMIRELSSDEYTNVLREWAPLASFAAKEAKEAEIRTAAREIRTVLRGMAVRREFFSLLGVELYSACPVVHHSLVA